MLCEDIDPMTGLYNRRYMEDTVRREMSRATRTRGFVGVILLDIDHFKRLNDLYGHQTGDLVLRQLASLIKDQIRSADVPCRYGGEEFLWILPGASLSVTAKRADQIRMALKNIRIHNNNQEVGPISISAGVSAFPDHGATPDELFRKADLALYQAKNEGRDRVVVFRQASADSKSRSLFAVQFNIPSG